MNEIPTDNITPPRAINAAITSESIKKTSFKIFSGIKKGVALKKRTAPVKMHILALVATQFITFRNSKFLCNAKRIHFYRV